MEQTPGAMRKHVALIGDVNAGKSTLFNALTGQENAIVSATPGTTTDPVRAAMELVPYGPVVLVDTAGSGDGSALGGERMRKTRAVLRRADVLLYVADAARFPEAAYTAFCRQGRPHLLVLTLPGGGTMPAGMLKKWPDALFFKPDDAKSLQIVRSRLAGLLAAQQPEDPSLLGDLLPAGSTVLMVAPVDSEAPKGRLILPQVQLLRDCLDHGITCHVCRETELELSLQKLTACDLVVTDSQVFGYVEQRLPEQLPLTSFSMLLARQKGNFGLLLQGAAALDTLPPDAHILVLEGCTHNHTHEDIGRVKIPAMLQKRSGQHLNFSFFSGYDFPEALGGYHLALQCGSCMLNRQEVQARLAAMEAAGLPVTNYGMALAWGAGILERSSAIFKQQGGWDA